MDKFYGNSLTQKYISNLLLNSEVPFIDFVNEGDFIIVDEVYIYQYQFIQCTKTGYVDVDAEYNVLDIYLPWNKYDKYTRKHTNTEGIYSSRTHRRLGDYLRAFSYNNGVNLMGMYNCYDYTSANNIKVVASDNNFIVEYHIELDDNQQHRVALIPIKYNRTYTISLECKSSFYVAPVLYYDNHLVLMNDGTDATNTYLSNAIKRYPMRAFNDPFTFEVDLSADIGDDDVLKQLYNRQRDLYLMIELSKANDTTIIVLEGNYASKKSLNYQVQGEHPSDEDLSYSPLLQMYQMDSQIPYSENLIQYLLSSAIYSSRENDYNVRKLRIELGLDEKGGYDSKVRTMVFNKTLQSSTSFKGDIYGYVDSNAEASI